MCPKRRAAREDRPLRSLSVGGKYFAIACAVGLCGCYSGLDLGLDSQGGATTGAAGDGAADESGDESGGLPDADADEVAISGLRRLSITEYRQTVADLVGVDPQQATEILPEDVLSPFDNDYTKQSASEALITAAELLAGDVANAVVESQQLRADLVPCEPSGASDEDCFREFIASFGRRALRRPLTDAEVDRYAGLIAYGVDEGDFWAAVAAGIRAFLQHPSFLYRVELGEPIDNQPGLFRLDAFEVGARLSYLLVGSTPPNWLLDAAEAGDLDDADGIAAAADRLLDDTRARERMDRFHALWLGYASLSREGVFGQMHDETNALLERMIFDEQNPWTDILTADETYLTAELAAHYGLPEPGSGEGWVKYGNSGRAGLLSHGTFLSVGTKFGDTSPTQRGLLIRTRLFCQEIPEPPDDLMVDVDEPPVGSDPDACKIDRYYMWDEDACASCHAAMDLIGFGLESYDASGAFREHEADRPECVIDGEGEFIGMGTFNGPAELAALAIESGEVEACVATQLYRYAVGRTELDEHDEVLLERLVADASGDGGLELFAWISEYVASPAFRHRREGGAQ